MFKLIHHTSDGAIIAERPTIDDCWATMKTIAPDTTPSVLWFPDNSDDGITVNFRFWFGPQPPLVECGPFLVPLDTYVRHCPVVTLSWVPDAPVAYNTAMAEPCCLVMEPRKGTPTLHIYMTVDHGMINVHAAYRPRTLADVVMQYDSPPPTLTSAALASAIMEALTQPDDAPIKVLRGDGRDLILKVYKL
ncbi:MAG: hypothetical protein D6790_15010 [Caldilineae bacterium]|nr:MAG: hypothetical protein D6790_15010 [Caldilineae bacterium]